MVSVLELNSLGLDAGSIDTRVFAKAKDQARPTAEDSLFASALSVPVHNPPGAWNTRRTLTQKTCDHGLAEDESPTATKKNLDNEWQ
jgi:hypothetical protein